MLREEGLGERVRPPRPPRRGDAARGARRGARGAVRGRARVLRLADRRADARWPRRRRGAQGHPRAFDMSLGTGLGKLAGKVFRIGHLGDFNDLTLAGTLAGVEMGLQRRRAGQAERCRGRAGAAPGRAVSEPCERTSNTARLRRAELERDSRRAARRRGRVRRLHPPPVLPGREHVHDHPARGRRFPGTPRDVVAAVRLAASSASRCAPAAPAPAWPGRPSPRPGARPLPAHGPDPRARPARAPRGSSPGWCRTT